MPFNIQETYGAIPCTVKYTVLDASLNTIISRTIVNPPGPGPQGCFTPDGPCDYQLNIQI